VNKKLLVFLPVIALTSCPMRVIAPVIALSPISSVSASVDDFNFTKSFFNQYSTLLNYELRLEYPIGLTDLEKATFRNTSIIYRASSGAGLVYLTDWNTDNAAYAVAELDNTWKGYFNTILFARNFDSSTGKAAQYPQLQVLKPNLGATANDTDLVLFIKSAIRFRIAPAEMLLAWSYVDGNAEDQFISQIAFYSDNILLNVIDLPQINATTALDTYKYTFPITITNANQLQFAFGLLDPTGDSAPSFRISEFNLFAESSIAVPDNADSAVFGITYIQVEWWDILGHLNNALWWLVNESFIAPVFQWIDDYIITFVSLIFNMLGDLLGI
jgi:hypothetical protein